MRRIHLLLILLFAAGCNLATPTPQAPAPTDSLPESGVTTTPAPSSTGCTVRSDWPVYTVTPGDTLSAIAALTGSTVDELVAANCLDNPDNLLVGQELHVPSLPAAGDTQTYTSAQGFAFDYPTGWQIQDIPGGPVSGIALTSFPYQFGSETPEAAWTPDMVVITFGYVPPVLASNTLDAWVQQDKQQLIDGGLQILSEEPVTLPSGITGVRIQFVSGSGHAMQNVYTIINGNPIQIGARGNFNLFNTVLYTLRPAS